MNDPLETVVAALKRAGHDPRSTGTDSYESRCPAHKGSRHNLSIDKGDDGKVLLHCHHTDQSGRGCDHKAILAALGLTEADMFPRTNGKATAGKTTKGKSSGFATPEAAAGWLCSKLGISKATGWKYPSADGTVRYAVFRFNEPKGKTYRPVYKDENGWHIGDPDGPLPLFNLPGLIPAPRVYLAEGEKCALLIRELGLIASTTGHGAKSPHRSDLSPLAGKDVVIVPDHDEEGEHYARQLVGLLAKLDRRPSVRIVRLPLEDKGDDVEQWLESLPEDWGPQRRRAELERLANEAPVEDLTGVAGVEGKTDMVSGVDRPEIEISTRWHEALEQTLAILQDDPDLYRRGDLLVRVEVEDRDAIPLTASTVLKGLAGMPRVITLSPANLGCRLTRIAEFYQWSKDRSGEALARNVRPPQWLIDAVSTHCHYPGVRPLLAVVECPYPRLDGSIVTTPGYDPDTGTIYRPSMTFLTVPDRPTREQAQAAAQRLLAIVRQFPFPTDADRAVWLAGLLTVVARPSIDGPVPGIAVIGNKAAVGKGLLIDLIGIIGTGRSVPTSTYPDEKEEAAKVKVSIAMASPPIVHFDNLDEGSFYGNGPFDSTLTSLTVNDRMLGSNRLTGEIALRTTWFLSGNNISPGKDAYRRWLPCNLVSDLERPEERDDIAEAELRKFVLAHRAESLHDVLTILAAHARSGYPDAPRAALGSFEQWDRIVRGAVLYAYGHDPCQTRRKAADEAPERLARLALLEGWRELPGGATSGVTTAAAIARATEHPDDYPTLRNALLHYGRDGKLATSGRIGNLIRAMRGNTIEGKRFIEVGKDHGAALWKVEIADKTPTSGESGESGESVSPPTPWRAVSDSDMMTYEKKSKEGRQGGGDTPRTPQTPREVRYL